jgi:hypothetical protein
MMRSFLKINLIILFASFFYSEATLALTMAIYKKPRALNLPATEWRFKREIDIFNSGDKTADAVIKIQLDSKAFDYAKAQANGEDIRFSTTPGSLKGAGLSYWIEQWNHDGISIIWVKMPKLKAHDHQKINMYYGNSQAQSISNGNTTFLFFDDFEEGNYTGKWTNVSIDSVVEKEGMLKLKGFDNKDGRITTNFNITGQMIIRTLYQRGGADVHWTRAGIGGWNKWLCFGDYTDWASTGTNYVMLLDSASMTNLKSIPLVKAANGIISDKWRHLAFWYDGKNLKGVQDDVTAEWPMINGSSKLALRTLDNDAWDSFAFITVSIHLNSEPIVHIGQQITN